MSSSEDENSTGCDRWELGLEDRANATRFLHHFNRHNRIGHLVVFRDNEADLTGEQSRAIRRECENKARTDAIILGSHERSKGHGSHFHIIHPCRGTTNKCQCSFGKKIKESCSGLATKRRLGQPIGP